MLFLLLLFAYRTKNFYVALYQLLHSQAINNWLTTGRRHQAIDPFGVPNEKCSATKSLPLDLRPDSFFEAVPSGTSRSDTDTAPDPLS